MKRFASLSGGLIQFTCIALICAASASLASGQAIERVTFTVDAGATGLPNSLLRLSGEASGVFSGEGTSMVNLLNRVTLAEQGAGAFSSVYTGTVTADVTFDIATRAVTGVRFVDASLVASNSGNWKPGNWNGSNFPNSGNETEAANYGGSVLGQINFATRNLQLAFNSGNNVYSVSSQGTGGQFVAPTGQNWKFASGTNNLFGSGLIDSQDQLTTYKNVLIDPNAVQPMMDINGNTPLFAGQSYQSNVVWGYIESREVVQLNDANGNPRFDGGGNPITITQNKYMKNPNGTYVLAPAFDWQNQFVDEDWYFPFDNAIGKPDVIRLYDPVTNDQGQLVMGNLDANIVGGSQNPSNISQTSGANNTFDLDLSLNADINSAFFVGDFAVSLRLAQAKFFGLPQADTGIIFGAVNANLLPGDINYDGVVDIFDVAQISNAWGSSGTPGLLLAGDGNGDGTVDIFDVALVSNNWGNMAGASGAQTAVPEPATAGLAAAAAFACLVSWRLRRGR